MMKLRMPSPDIPEDGFTDCDILGRKQLAQSIISITEKIEDNLVFLLDAPWGTGKTFFLKQFENYSKSQGFPCIYFDAFSNDIRQDAFSAITSEIIESLKDNPGEAAKLARPLLKKAGVVGKHLLTGVAAATAHYATAGVLNAELISRISSDPKIAAAIKAGTDKVIKNSISSATESLITNHKATRSQSQNCEPYSTSLLRNL
ncbi:MAG: P-loop NTPase fold protein [Pseudomonadota bacterium]